MHTQRMVPVSMAAVLLGFALSTAPALAADPMPSGKGYIPLPSYSQSASKLTSTERCKLYERRFDGQVAAHEQAARIDEARTLRIEGGRLCSQGSQALGASKLREALDYIGVDSKV